ncbi:MAG: ATPase [Pacificimonas sp.]
MRFFFSLLVLTSSSVAFAAEESAGMPQFDFARVAVPQVVWLLLTFALLFILMQLMLPKVAGVTEKRAGTIGGDLEAAETARLDADTRREAYEAKIAGSRGEAQDLIGAAKADAAKANEARMAEVDARVAERLAEADAELAAQKADAFTRLDVIAADATQDIVERLTGERPDETVATAAVSNVSATTDVRV